MAYTDDDLTGIFARTDGRCHLCFARLAYTNYGRRGARGAWEVEHSVPRAQGGTDRMHNLYAACIACNRAKGTRPTRAVRGENGYRAAPLSTAKRERARLQNALLGALVGYVVALVLHAGRDGVWLLVIVAMVIGHHQEPDPQRR